MRIDALNVLMDAANKPDFVFFFNYLLSAAVPMEIRDPASQISSYFLRIHAGGETDRCPDGYADFSGWMGDAVLLFHVV